jgi:hypothetical protein
MHFHTRQDGLPVAATITIQDSYVPVFSDPQNGDYYRVLLEGTCI